MRSPIPPIQRIVETLHTRLKENHDGEAATYIPELGRADPGWFGICLVTADGRIYQVGDCDMLSIKSFDGLQASGPELLNTILGNLSRILADRLRGANDELALINA